VLHCSYERQAEGTLHHGCVSTAQHSTVQHSTAQRSAAQHSAAQHFIAHCSAGQQGTAQHGTAQFAAARSIAFQLDGMHAWAARYTTCLLIELTPKRVVFSFLFLFLCLPLPHASKPSQMPAMRHLTLSSSSGSPGFTAGLSSFTSFVPESSSTVSVVPLSALQEPRMCGDLWHNVSQT